MKKYILPLVLFVVCAALLMMFIGIGCSSLLEAQAEIVTLPSYGVVGDNLLVDSDFSYYNTSWQYNSMSSVSYNPLTLVSSANYAGYYYQFPDPSLFTGRIFTLSICARSLSGQGALSARYRVASSGGTSQIGQVVFTNSDYRVISTTVNLSSYSSFNLFRFVIYANTAGAQIQVKWAKIEIGEEFTGYVPSDYTNYGYDQGLSEGTVSGKNSVYQTNNGWTKYDIFRDYKTDDTYSNEVTSSNGGAVSYVSSIGMKLTSPANGTSFLLSFNEVSLSSSNMTLTFALGYSGTFNKGDVVLSFDYSYYSGTSSSPPWNGISPVDTSFSYSLDPGLVFVQTIYPIRDFPSGITLTIRSGTDFYLEAFKCETGSKFTMFPTGSSSEVASFNNGYSSGMTTGLEQGYNTGYTEGFTSGNAEGLSVGFDQGFSEGRTEGYSLGLSTAQNGTFFALFSSLIDVPVSALISLLDYDFFGINMWNFARFVLTLVLFFAVLHFFTKGKLKA